MSNENGGRENFEKVCKSLFFPWQICEAVSFRTKAQIIDGKRISEEVQNEIKNDVDKWVAEGHRRPCLIAVLVGEDPASQTYVNKKMIAAKAVGKYIPTFSILFLPDEKYSLFSIFVSSLSF